MKERLIIVQKVTWKVEWKERLIVAWESKSITLQKGKEEKEDLKRMNKLRD